MIRKKTTGNSRVTKETERIQSLGRSLPISALHLTSSGPFLISLRPAGAPLRGTRWKGYEVRDETRADMMGLGRQSSVQSVAVKGTVQEEGRDRGR